jgi:hypothetical protein
MIQNTYIALVVLSILVIILMMSSVKKEQFTDMASKIECPIAATRTPDGRIKVEPGKQIFSSMNEYTTYLAGLYSKGSKCIPPMVKNNKTPVDQILGGLGNNVAGKDDIAREDVARNVLTENAFNEAPINKLDDYEKTQVYNSERDGRNELSVQSKNNLLYNRALDWAQLPFNSEEHARNADTFVAGRLETAYIEPKTGIYFRNVEGGALLPPDVEAEKMREKQILASYRPTDITKHTIDSKTEQVAKLVNQMYSEDPNWIPVVEKQSDNNYAVTELLPKPREEKYEDNSAQRLSLLEESGKIIPPPTLRIEDRLRDDPYFDKSGLADRDNDRLWNYNDFRKWTPGLERMFAPTADNKEWY